MQVFLSWPVRIIPEPTHQSSSCDTAGRAQAYRIRLGLLSYLSFRLRANGCHPFHVVKQ